MSDDPTQAELIAAIQELSELYRTNSEATEALEQEVDRRKTETRWVALGVVLVIAVALVGAGVLRHTDRRAAIERSDRVASQLLTQRENQVQGCERGNDQRRTLAEVIGRAIQPSSTPITTDDPELRSLLEQSRERTVALRAELLTLPGVQIVDCRAANPLPPQDQP